MTWRTRIPARIARFDLYRSRAIPSAHRTRIAWRLADRRHTYRFVDRGAPLRTVLRYWLSAVRRDGTRATCGPVSIIT